MLIFFSSIVEKHHYSAPKSLLVLECLVAGPWETITWIWKWAHLLCGNFHEIWQSVDLSSNHININELQFLDRYQYTLLKYLQRVFEEDLLLLIRYKLDPVTMRTKSQYLILLLLASYFFDHKPEFCSSGQLMLCSGISLMYFIGNVVSWRTLAIIGKPFI